MSYKSRYTQSMTTKPVHGCGSTRKRFMTTKAITMSTHVAFSFTFFRNECVVVLWVQLTVLAYSRDDKLVIHS